jgi:hypothetical protein
MIDIANVPSGTGTLFTLSTHIPTTPKLNHSLKLSDRETQTSIAHFLPTIITKAVRDHLLLSSDRTLLPIFIIPIIQNVSTVTIFETTC